ncbi:hypothetical protein [Rhodopirellula sp. P2]|uniref:hypothetical protein n=1 Tax=Rhodopirellula sp. P2 TaxID=2127060 RepID=UPI002368B65E|nr:hypothetical protein [Rhodopirellula sp. P2]WDQ16582.1 hypothetical protein PSR62_23620 [Rhodopirellula sp. P2]
MGEPWVSTQGAQDRHASASRGATTVAPASRRLAPLRGFGVRGYGRELGLKPEPDKCYRAAVESGENVPGNSRGAAAWESLGFQPKVPKIAMHRQVAERRQLPLHHDTCHRSAALGRRGYGRELGLKPEPDKCHRSAVEPGESVPGNSRGATAWESLGFQPKVPKIAMHRQVAERRQLPLHHDTCHRSAALGRRSYD